LQRSVYKWTSSVRDSVCWI